MNKFNKILGIVLSFQFLIFSILNPSNSPSYNESSWKLTKEEGDLKIYKRLPDHSKMYEIKINNVLNHSADKIVRMLDDVNNYSKWIYKCSESKVLDRISDTEMVYYTLADLPSPFWDRDIISHSVYRYDATSDTHYFNSEEKEGYLEERKKVIRVPNYYSSWKIKEVSPNKCEVENIVFVDPGGSIPSWLQNMAVTKGPYKSMKGMEDFLDTME